ncbi:9431_t:CDS:1, partial [Gigaspora rosea]
NRDHTRVNTTQPKEYTRIEANNKNKVNKRKTPLEYSDQDLTKRAISSRDSSTIVWNPNPGISETIQRSEEITVKMKN